MVPEAYRQKLRDCRKEPNQTHVEFARTKEQLFDRWCSSKKVGSDHAKLRQLMLVEEFKWCITHDMEKDWDEGIHLLLFAVRESVQESLGFSPFELVIGHTVRGPLKVHFYMLISLN